MSKTIEFLRAGEWTMGNGQCHECDGKDPAPGKWDGRGNVGHWNDCPLALALQEQGEEVVFVRPALPADPNTAKGKALLEIEEWSERVAGKMFLKHLGL